MDAEIDYNGLNNDTFSVYNDLLMHGIGLLLPECCDIESMELNGHVFEYLANNSLELIPGNYFIGYSKWESSKLFKKISYVINSKEKDTEKKDYWKNKKQEIEFYIAKLTADLRNYPFFATDLNQVILDIEIRFKELTDSSPSIDNTVNTKLKWLGTTNQLATLFWDLWKGQENREGQTTKSMIDTNKNDLMAFLINNFIDKTNEDLKPSTLSDYLNQAKPDKRAKEGVRIEITTPK
jgi:hypothetical protein